MWTGNLVPVSNREAWTETVTYAPTDGSAIPTLDEIVVSISGDGCSTKTKKLSAAEITNDPVAGSFTFVFSASDMRVRPGSYDVGMVLTIADTPTQLFAGAIEVIDGVVP